MARMAMTAEELRDLALAAVEEAAEAARFAPVQRTKGLAFALAYLFAYSGAPRGNFDRFWREVGKPNNAAAVRTALEGVRVALKEQSIVTHAQPWRDQLLPSRTCTGTASTMSRSSGKNGGEKMADDKTKQGY